VTRRALLALLVLAASLAAASRPLAQPSAATPKLLVTLVIDQMRFDYIERYGKKWNGGLHRLVTEGAVFERAMYPYLNTVTCAGHATIGTGALPYRHGIILNEWYRREVGRRMACTDDHDVTSVPYTPPAEPVGHSARRLRMPTLPERLRGMSPASRSVALSMKPRSTVMLAGHGGTAVTWFSDANSWGTSTAFTKSAVPEVQAFIDANPVERDRSITWDRIRPLSDYVGNDDESYERGRRGWTRAFPHPLSGAPGTAPAQFFELWERSPYSDAYLGRMAAALIRAYGLGQRDAIDTLAISFSALDYVGHDFGPDSHEVQDTLFRLDQTLGELLTVLDTAVGRDKYVVGLSADHGVSRIPEALRTEGDDAGRVLNPEVEKAAEAAMTGAYGAGPHVALVEYTNVYLTSAARARAQKDPTFVRPIIDAVSKLPGVQRVFSSHDLTTKRTSPDPIERAAALSHHPDESGDVVVVLKPNWIGTNSSAATHGSAQWYDQHVPVIFMGAPFKPGRYGDAASPADLSPTLASTIKLMMSDVDGKVRKEALR
jgi:predicted AlkP superfamily pyrophosphatase or phosphodiesterase